MKEWIVIICIGVCTYLTRFLPMNSESLQKNAFIKSEAFALLPLCILAALVGPSFFPIIKAPEDVYPISLILGGLATVLLTQKLKSIMWGALCGFSLFLFLDFLFHVRT